MEKLDLYFGKKVEIPRIYFGKHQILETLINEEALLLAKFLRDERKRWNARIPEAITKTGGNQT